MANNKTTIQTYVPGDWNVICDMCGFKRKASQCVMQQIPEAPNLFVCKETCLDKHNEQYDVTGVIDRQTVPIVRDDSNSNIDGYEGSEFYSGPITAADLIDNGIH